MISKERCLVIRSALHDIEFMPGHKLYELLDMTVELSFNSNRLKSLVLLLKTLVIFPSKRYFLSNNFEPSFINKINVLVCTASSQDRITTFFKGLKNHSEVNSNYTYPSNSESVISPGIFIKVSRKLISLRLFFAIFRLERVCFFEKIEIIRLLIIQHATFITWQKVLNANTYHVLLFDLDRYPTNAPIVLAAKTIGIRTATIVHGSTHPIDNYIPVISDYLLVWGHYHLKQFADYLDSAQTQMVVIGNPKINDDGTNNHERRVSVIGLATTFLPGELHKEVLEVFEEGTRDYLRVVKAHPLEEHAGFNSVLKSKNLKVLFKETPRDFLKSIDILCVRNSQMGSDALPYNIPIIIIDCNHGQNMQNGELLSLEAGCPLVQNHNDLTVELHKLARDEEYYAQRIFKQNKFRKELFEYTGVDSDKKLLEFILDLRH